MATFSIPAKVLMSPNSLQRYRTSPVSRTYSIPLNAVDVGSVLSGITDGSVRYNLLDQFAASVPENQNVLQQIVDLSYVVARIFHKKNYAEYKMCDTLIKQPHEVMVLLQRCLNKIRPFRDRYFEELRKEKKRHLGGNQTLHRWDISLYDGIMTSRRVQLLEKDVSVFTAEGILRGGIAPLLRDMFDVQLEPVPIGAEELWTRKTKIEKYRVIHGSRVLLLCIIRLEV